MADEQYNQRLNHLVSSITVDPVGRGAFTTTYAYTFDSSGCTQTTETRADGSKRIVNWNPDGSPDEYLRQVEYLTDTNGSTYLESVATGWTTTTSGKLAGTTTTTHYHGGSPVGRPRSNYDGYGPHRDALLREQPANDPHRPPVQYKGPAVLSSS
jgi:hypothetical protein